MEVSMYMTNVSVIHVVLPVYSGKQSVNFLRFRYSMKRSFLFRNKMKSVFTRNWFLTTSSNVAKLSCIEF